MSNKAFIKEPPEPSIDPCCRIMEPSRPYRSIQIHNPEAKIKSFVDTAPNKLIFDLPPKMRSFEEPAKMQLTIETNIGSCVNCEGRFRLQTMRLNGKLCANCFKIHESVSRTV